MSPTDAELVLDLLIELQVVVSTVALFLSVVAERGYRGTPWGRVLQPMPVLMGSILLVVVVQRTAVPRSTYQAVSAALWTVATAAIVLATYRANAVLRGESS